MKKLITSLTALGLLGCMNEGDRHTHVYNVTPCEVAEGNIVCGDEAYPIEQKEPAICEVHLPEPQIITVEKEIVVEKEVVVEVPVEDTTAQELPQPVVIKYHGVVCNNVPVVSLDGRRYVMHGGKLNILHKGHWLTVWEHNNGITKRGCYVKIRNNGKVKSRYIP